MPSHVILAVNAAFLNDSERARIAIHLRDAGYETFVSRSVNEALSLVFVNRRIEAVVIYDYAETRTGPELVSTVHAINPLIPILVVEVDPHSQTSPIFSERLVALSVTKLEQIWQGESRGSQFSSN